MNPKNRPNQAWRAKMRRACAAWLDRWHWPDGGVSILKTPDLRQLATDGYQAGYEAGRASLQHQPKEKP